MNDDVDGLLIELSPVAFANSVVGKAFAYKLICELSLRPIDRNAQELDHSTVLTKTHH